MNLFRGLMRGKGARQDAPTADDAGSYLNAEHVLYTVLAHGMSDAKALGRAGCVSRIWRDVCADDSLWRSVYEQSCGVPRAHELCTSWKEQNLRSLAIGYSKPSHVCRWKIGVMTNSVCIVDDNIVFGDDDSSIHVVPMSACKGGQLAPGGYAVEHTIAEAGAGADPTSPAMPPATPPASTGNGLVSTYKHALPGDPERLWSVVPAGSGRVVSAGVDSVVRLWDVRTGECLREFRGHGGSISSLSAEGNRVVSASADATLKVWDLGTGACLRTLTGHSKMVTSVATTGNLVVSGSADCTVRVWDMDTGKCLHVCKGHTEQVRAVAVLRSAHVVSGSWDRTVRVWNLETGQCEHVLQGTEAVWSLATSGNAIVSGEASGALKMWNAATWQCSHTINAHANLVRGICIGADSLLSVSDDGNLEWHDLGLRAAPAGA